MFYQFKEEELERLLVIKQINSHSINKRTGSINYYRLKPVVWQTLAKQIKSVNVRLQISWSHLSYDVLPGFLYIFCTSSWVTLPTVETKYPLAHRCWPQYRFFRCVNSMRCFRLVFPLIYCTAFERERLGGTERRRCTWPGLMLSLTISM